MPQKKFDLNVIKKKREKTSSKKKSMVASAVSQEDYVEGPDEELIQEEFTEDPQVLDEDFEEDSDEDFEEDSDEEDKIPPPKPKKKVRKPRSKALVSAKREKKTTALTTKNDDIDTSYAITKGVIGDSISRFSVQKYRGALNRRDRIAIISLEIYMVKTHYVEGVGYFMAFPDSERVVGKLPSVHYVLPIIKYDTVKGKIVSRKFDYMYLMLPFNQYNSLVELQEVLSQEREKDVNLAEIDLLVTCSDETYQKNNFQLIGPATWSAKGNESFMEEVMETHEDLWPKVEFAIAKPMDREKYLKLVDGEVDPSVIPSEEPVNLNDLTE